MDKEKPLSIESFIGAVGAVYVQRLHDKKEPSTLEAVEVMTKLMENIPSIPASKEEHTIFVPIASLGNKIGFIQATDWNLQ